MASAVEKMKNIGLRFGDKVVVLLAAALFVWCVMAAFSRPAPELTPDQIKKFAEASDGNLNRRVEPEQILESITESGIKVTDFAKQAEESASLRLIASNYAPQREWVTPEPGAGLIRDQPKLIAPSNLFAYPGRGGALVYELDAEGKRVEQKPEDAPKAPVIARRKSRGGMMGSGMMGSGMMGPGMGGGMGQALTPEQERQMKAEQERRQREMRARLAGSDEPAAEPDEDAANAMGGPGMPGMRGMMKPMGPPPKEITKGLRWVALTGTLDHGQMLTNYREALKNPAIAQPNYARLDVQRMRKQADGSWTDWAPIAVDKNLEILDNLPEEDEELTPENVRPTNLVDPLPFLNAGLWEKVHIASLVPKELKEVAPAQPGMMGPGMMGPGMMGSGGMMMGSSGMDPSMGRGMMTSGMMMGSGSGGMMGPGMMGPGMMGMGGMNETLANFWKSTAKKVMVRALDFTPEQNESYRYRVRVVVFNPNLGRDDVSPGVDTKAKELFGPWSEPTDEVHMPPDVTAYAMGTMPPTAKSDKKVLFQVVKFDPGDGVTVPRNFEAGPGEIIGEVRTADVPVSDGTGKKSKAIDFNSHQLVIDVDGGFQPLPSDFPGNVINRPALAVLLRGDGSVIVRAEADDRPDEVRKDVDANYKREIKESDKVRANSMGGGYGSMMGSGMMGSGMMPGMMGSGGRR